MSESFTPGGELSSRPLHFFWIADASGSMAGDKIQSLNYAISTALPAMRAVASENPYAKVLIRAIMFQSTASWHTATSQPIETYEWNDLSADGETAMGGALTLLADALKIPPMPARGFPPVVVLLTDGQPTDDLRRGLRAVNDQPWGKKSVRIAIAIGRDANLQVLRDFLGNSEREPLVANNAETLVNYIQWVSTAVVQSASSPASQTSPEDASGLVPLTTPPEPVAITDPRDLW